MKLAAKFLGATLLSLVLFTPAFAQGPFYGTPVPNIPSPQKTGTPSGLLRSCQARESAIKTRMMHLTQLANDMISKFDSIATKVETYYTTKVVPSGKTVKNYDALVADIQTKKNAVTTALNKAQTDVNGFSCTDGHPKADIQQFRVDMQAVKMALKNYRTSIKNLIVAVHSVVGKTESSSKPSPVPSP